MKDVVVLTRTLGDVVLGNVLAHNIKLQFPDSELDYIVESRYADILLGNPAISGVVPIRETRSEWDDVLHKISNGSYRHVFLPQQTTREDNIWHQVEKHRHQHLVDFYAKRCGIRLSDRRLIVFPQLKDGDPVADKGTVVVHARTLVPSKDWAHFGEFVIRLREKGVRVVQVGTSEDSTVPSDEDLRGKLSLRQLIVYLKSCSAFVGLDSGISYLAAAVGIPTYVIQGPTIPETSGPFGPNVVNLLSPTRKECETVRCHGNCRFVQEEPLGSCINRWGVDDIWKQIGDELCEFSSQAVQVS